MFNREYYRMLSDKDKYCAQQIEYFSSEIPFLSIHELAAKLYVSSASLSRLVKKLGYNNYKEFKNSFVVSQVNHSISPSAILNSHLNTIFTDYPIIIENCVIPLITNANKIFILAFGGSANIGQELQLTLSKLKLSSFLISDSDFVPLIDNMIGINDIIIFISYTGEDADMCAIALRYKYTNKQLLLTSTLNSTLSTYVSLIINTFTDDQNFPLKTRGPLYTLVDLICIHLIDHNI